MQVFLYIFWQLIQINLWNNFFIQIEEKFYRLEEKEVGRLKMLAHRLTAKNGLIKTMPNFKTPSWICTEALKFSLSIQVGKWG